MPHRMASVWIRIWIDGQQIEVSHNTVRNVLARDNGDADGMRFFGNGHRITGNTITDISDHGYANPPHPDCFQTYDDNSPPTFDILIAGNTCRNVGAQCLIATGDQHGNSGAPTGGPSITFVDNFCANNGAQAVNLRRWRNVEIRDNRFSGRNVTRGNHHHRRLDGVCGDRQHHRRRPPYGGYRPLLRARFAPGTQQSRLMDCL
jgi:hypothetical protein